MKNAVKRSRPGQKLQSGRRRPRKVQLLTLMVLFQNSTSTKKPAVWSMVDVDRRPDCSFFGRLQPALFITPFFRQICFSLSCKCSFKFYSFLTKHIRRDPPSFIFIVFFFSIVIKLKRAYQQIGL